MQVLLKLTSLIRFNEERDSAIVAEDLIFMRDAPFLAKISPMAFLRRDLWFSWCDNFVSAPSYEPDERGVMSSEIFLKS